MGNTSKEKLNLLGRLAKFDVSGYPKLLSKKMLLPFIYPAVAGGGKVKRLLKILQSNICENNCYYCANRKERNFPRMELSPYELAFNFYQLYKRGLVEGLFLSSSIKRDANFSQEKMLESVYTLRRKLGYSGYIHLKVLPGADLNLIYECAKFADRLSVNLEAPKQKYLSKLSPDKDLCRDLLGSLKSIHRVGKVKALKCGITTQLVVGAASETDEEILSFSNDLYKRFDLWRVYYSGFYPIKNTPLESKPACSSWREMRLYQADWLLRKYGFKVEELPFNERGNLPQDLDPKLAWAKQNPQEFPIEVNKASLSKLLKVPGIGRISAERIVKLRRQQKIKSLQELKKLGVVVKRTGGFLTLDGKLLPPKRPKAKEPFQEQLFLWEEI